VKRPTRPVPGSEALAISPAVAAWSGANPAFPRSWTWSRKPPEASIPWIGGASNATTIPSWILETFARSSAKMSGECRGLPSFFPSSSRSPQGLSGKNIVPWLGAFAPTRTLSPEIPMQCATPSISSPSLMTRAIRASVRSSEAPSGSWTAQIR
jgi:hypothetical protein